jgi:hypothetical protein
MGTLFMALFHFRVRELDKTVRAILMEFYPHK